MLTTPQDKNFQKYSKAVCFTGSDFAYSTTLAIHRLRLQELVMRFSMKTHANQLHRCIIIATAGTGF